MSALRHESIVGYEEEIRRLFWENILIGQPLPFALAARRAYERLCLDWYLANPQHSVVVIAEGRVIGYALVCANQLAHHRNQRRQVGRLLASVLAHLVVCRLSIPSFWFYVLRVKDSLTIATSRHSIPADIDVHAHVNIDFAHHDGAVALSLRKHIDSVCLRTGRAGWFGEMNAVGGKRIVGIRRVVGEVVAANTNHTLSWLLNSDVDRLTMIRRTVKELAA